MDEELIGQREEAVGDSTAVCDLCGQAMDRSQLHELAVDRGMAEPVEAVRVCPACGRAVELGELPFDAEIAAGLQAADSER